MASLTTQRTRALNLPTCSRPVTFSLTAVRSRNSLLKSPMPGRKATSQAEQALITKLESLRAGVRERFTGMDAAKIDEALRPVDELLPSGSADISFTDLRARIEMADARCAHAARVLEELQAAGNLARVQVSQVVTEPITSEGELDVALGRVRQVALVELADGKQVRLQ